MATAYVEIPLTQGKVALIDVDDYGIVSQHSWYALKNKHCWYARRNIKIGDRTTAQGLHMIITGYKITDHKNGNGLDNRRVNLREATHGQNLSNKRKFLGTSKFKGVCWSVSDNGWKATIQYDKKLIQLGTFKEEIQAALVYDEVARKYHGEFAALNFPKSGERSAL